MLRKIKAMLLFAKSVEWVDEPSWEIDDAKRFSQFLASDTGIKLKGTLTNMTLRINSRCIQSKKDLAFEAGFANGFRGAVSSLEGLADSELYGSQDDGEPDLSELIRQ
jgi:hypothetical protein